MSAVSRSRSSCIVVKASSATSSASLSTHGSNRAITLLLSPASNNRRMISTRSTSVAA